MDREKVIKELDKIADEVNPWKESPPLRCDIPYPLLCDALELLKEQEDEKKRIMRVIWDTLHEGLSIDTVADQDWVYEQIRHRIEDT